MHTLVLSINWLDKYWVEDESGYIRIARRWILIIAACSLMAIITPRVGRYIFCGYYEFGEEFMKCISLIIGGPIAYLYTLAFSIMEFFQYLSMYGEIYEAAGTYWNFVLVRILCIGIHFIFLMIQISVFKGMKSVVDSGFIGYILTRINGLCGAALFHVFYNTYGNYVMDLILE